MLKLKQPENGYKYNSDTVVLYNFVSLFYPKDDILEIGSGCGILSLMIKRDFDCEIKAVEKQKEMFEISLKNSKENNLSVEFFNVDLNEFKSNKKFDFIVSNPPFYDHTSSTSSNVLKKIARYDDNLSLDLLVKKTNSLIKTKGEFIFCYDSTKLQSVLLKLSEYKFRVKTMQFVYGSDKKNSNIVLIRAVKTNIKQCKVIPPFFFFKDKIATKEAKEISLKADCISA